MESQIPADNWGAIFAIIFTGNRRMGIYRNW